MSLQNLNEELHGRDFHDERMKTHTPYDPGVASADATKKEAFTETGSWKDVPKKTPEDIALARFRRRRMIAWGLGIFAGLLLLGGIIFKVRQLLFSEEAVLFSVIGPRQVASAESTEFTIEYANRNWGELKNASLFISHSDAFQPEVDSRLSVTGNTLEIPIGTIAPRSEGRTSFSGKFYGKGNDNQMYFKIRLRYTPQRVGAQYEKEDQYGVEIRSSALFLDLTAPQQVASDQDVEYAIDYANRSDVPYDNLRVKIDYPEGFVMLSSEPRVSEGNSVWYVGTLEARKQGKIIVRGKMSGVRDEVKKVTAHIGYFGSKDAFVSFSDIERLTRVVLAPLSIRQTINGSGDLTADAGTLLDFKVSFRNTSDVGYRDAIVVVRLDSPLLDYAGLRRTGGAFDYARKTLIWKASDIPVLGRLNPGESGEIEFSIPVLNPLPSSVSGNNFSVQSVATIDSPDIPTPVGSNKIIGSNTTLVKINSAASLDVVLASNDSMFNNSGPIPPRVGEETLYTVRLSLINRYNDIDDAKVTAVLAGNTRYLGKYVPESDSASFNDRTNELVWNIGVLKADRGATRTLRFQIGNTPDESQGGTALRLFGSVILSGKDRFTGRDVKIEYPLVNGFRNESGNAVELRVEKTSE